ncbi:hypothetical protein PM082_016342 [Marasmius tenuissimus]|nr:hypothetical protein PM082_016342 [Marasmius tenuissimus]
MPFLSITILSLLGVAHALVPRAATCSKSYTVVSGDTCTAIDKKFGLTTGTAISLNSAVNSGCTNLYIGQSLCVQLASSPNSGACTNKYTVVSGDNCNTIEKKLGLASGAVQSQNPSVNSGCTNLYPSQTICVDSTSTGGGSTCAASTVTITSTAQTATSTTIVTSTPSAVTQPITVSGSARTTTTTTTITPSPILFTSTLSQTVTTTLTPASGSTTTTVTSTTTTTIPYPATIQTTGLNCPQIAPLYPPETGVWTYQSSWNEMAHGSPSGPRAEVICKYASSNGKDWQTCFYDATTGAKSNSPQYCPPSLVFETVTVTCSQVTETRTSTLTMPGGTTTTVYIPTSTTTEYVHYDY